MLAGIPKPLRSVRPLLPSHQLANSKPTRKDATPRALCSPGSKRARGDEESPFPAGEALPRLTQDSDAPLPKRLLGPPKTRPCPRQHSQPLAEHRRAGGSAQVGAPRAFGLRRAELVRGASVLLLWSRRIQPSRAPRPSHLPKDEQPFSEQSAHQPDHGERQQFPHGSAPQAPRPKGRPRRPPLTYQRWERGGAGSSAQQFSPSRSRPPGSLCAPRLHPRRESAKGHRRRRSRAEKCAQPLGGSAGPRLKRASGAHGGFPAERQAEPPGRSVEAVPGPAWLAQLSIDHAGWRLAGAEAGRAP